MKLVHLSAADRFADNQSYQINNLIKYHKMMGYDVEVIASTDTFNQGKFVHTAPVGQYVGENEVLITRIPFKRNNKLYYIKKFRGLYDALENAKPDIMFIHGCQFLDMNQVVRYLKKHPSVKVYVDNHADTSNSATNWFSRVILHNFLWRRCAHRIEPYTTKFYGVLPARVDFLLNVYKLPSDKCELLVMGADDELVEKAKTSDARARIREQYGIKDNDFLIMTGGKIDQWKTQTLLLMQAVQNIDRDNVRLIVFGSVTQELMDQVKSLADGTKVQYIGWVLSKDSYDYFEAADLVVFPGRHSVFWEQVTGQGKPMLVKDWPGTHHVDIGGNVRFLTQDSVEEIQEEIERLLHNPDEYERMKAVAQDKGMEVFSYKDIARRAIQTN